MKLRYTLLTFTLTLMLLSAAASAADDPQIHSFAIAPAGDQFSVIGKTGQFALIHNSTSKRVEFSISSKSFVSTAAALSSNSQWLALGAEDGSILLYDNVPDLWEGRAISLEKLPNFTPVGHDYEVQAVAFSPDGKMLASGAADGSLKLLFLTTSTSKKQSSISLADQPMGGIQAIVFSSDGKTLAVGTENGAITLWDIERQRVKKRYDPHDDSYDVTALAFSEDNKTLAAGTSNSELTLWDVSRHQRITTLEGHDGTVGAINALAFSTDGKLLVSGADDKKVMLWNTETQQKIGEYSQGSTVLSIAFTADGQTLIMGDKGGKIKRPAITDFHISPRAGEQDQVAQQTQPTPRKRSTTSRFQRGVTKKQTQNNTQRTAKAKKQDSIPSKLYEEITPPKNSRLVHSVAFATSTDKPTYILGQQNYFLLTTAQRQHQSVKLPNLYPGSTVVSAAFSHTLKYALALSAEKGNLLLFYDSLDDKSPMIFNADSRVNDVTYSPDTPMLAVGTAKKVSTRNTKDGNLFINQIDIPGIAKSLAFSPNSQILAVGRALGTIELWDVFEHTRLKSLKPESNYGAKSLAFSPNGKMLAVGKVITGQIELWNVLSAQMQGSFTNQHHGTVNSVAFSPNGKTLASGAEDGKVLLWDIQTQEKIDPIERFKQKHPNFNGTGHGENVKILSVAFSDDGKTLMSGDETGLVLLWDLSTIDIDTGPSTDLIASKEVQEESKSTPQIGENSNQKNREQEIPTTVEKPEKIKPEIAVEYQRNVSERKRVVMISGTVKGDRNGIQLVTIDNKEIGIALEEASTYYFQTTVELEEEGDNTFTITATDNEGRTGSEEFKIHRKPISPNIKVMSPQLDANNFAEISHGQFEIKVKVTDESEIEYVKCNDEEMEHLYTDSAESVYRKSFKDSLRRKRTFKITAKDTKGSPEAKQEFTITPAPVADETPPTIEIISKKREVAGEQESADISGTVKDADSGIKSVKIGDAEVRLDSTPPTTRNPTPPSKPTPTPSTTPNQEEDDNPLITFRNSDLRNNGRHETREDYFLLRIFVIDDSQTKVGIERKFNERYKNIIAPSMVVDDKYEVSLSLSNGTNEFRITAEDRWENSEKQRFMIVKHQKDTEGPTITDLEVDNQAIRFEGAAITVRQQRVHISGSVTDVSGIQSVTIKSPSGTFAVGGSFETDIPLKGGSNQITVTATDTAGNLSTRTFTIYQEIDTEGPTIRITRVGTQAIRPTDNSITVTEEGIRIQGSVNDPSGVNVNSVKVNGEPVKVEHDGSFQQYIYLDDEENHITVTATDTTTAENLSTYRFTIHREIDKEGPTITLRRVGTQAIPPTDNAILVNEEEVLIHGSVTDPNGVYSLTFNGDKVTVASNGTFEHKLFLNYGENPIIVEATDERENSREHSFTINHQFDRTGKDFALFFATREYDSTAELPSAIKDAEAVAEDLRDNYGFETRVFENLSKLKIVNTLYKYADDFEGIEYATDSQLLIFFAGHGHYDERGNEGYLITKDTQPHEVDPTFATALSHTKLRKQIIAMKCQRILVMLDTCFSGTFDPDFVVLPADPVLRQIFDGTSLLKKIKAVLQSPARWCLTAAGDQYVVDGGINHSPFANAFLTALNTRGGGDLLLELDEVWKEIQKSKDDAIYAIVMEKEKEKGNEFKLPEPRKGRFGTSSSESNFYFFPKVQ